MRFPLHHLLYGLATATLVCGCGGGQPTAEPPPAPKPTTQPAPVASAEEPPPRSRDPIAAALAEVAKIRELKPKGPVQGEVVSRERMIEMVRKEVSTSVPAHVLEGSTEMLVALGTVPVDFDYKASLMQLMTAQLAGFYEPKTKKMYLAGDLGSLESAATLSHELVHALQDQHFGLGKRIEFREEASDEQTAIHALAEGGATSAMLDQLLAPAGKRASELPDSFVRSQIGSSIGGDGMDGVPPIVSRSVLSSYLDGTLFVHWARRRGGWKAVDDIWRNPPATSEQLLHPKKLLSKEPAIPVAVPVAPPKSGMKLLFKDKLGEQSVRLVLEEWMPLSQATQAAAGWGGDRLAVYRKDDKIAVAWTIVYDDEKSAERGFKAFQRGLSAQAGRSTKSTPTQACVLRPKLGPFAAAIAGPRVTLTMGPYERVGQGVRPVGTCAASIKWATAIRS